MYNENVEKTTFEIINVVRSKNLRYDEAKEALNNALNWIKETVITENTLPEYELDNYKEDDYELTDDDDDYYESESERAGMYY